VSQKGYTGISYPFRITSRGGVAVSTCTETDPRHIKEALQQLLGVNYLERPMEGGEFYSNLSASLFEPNDESLQSVLRSRIMEAIDRLEQRIEVEEDGLEFIVETEEGVDYLYVLITYTVLRYETSFTAKVKIGETVNE